MRKTYHICISAGDEILCRDEEDYNRCYNSLALAIAETESSLLVESVMSNHLHECVRTSYPEILIEKQRYKYARYFNAKYHRKGRLGEKYPFIIELQGLYHTLAAMSYTLRNAVHHGIAPTPFAYPHCSARAIFQKELGYDTTPVLMQDSHVSRHLSARCRCPKGWRMDRSGLLLRKDIVDNVDVEHMYGTPRAYLYYMNRISGEEWKREQDKDMLQTAPITLPVIENGIVYQTVEQMLQHEHGRNDYRKVNDMDLCQLIDKTILPKYGYESVYLLPDRKKSEIAGHLSSKHRLPTAQIRRCLAIL